MTGYHMDAACFYRNPCHVPWELLGVIPGRSVLPGAVCRLLLGILACSGQCQRDAGKAGGFPSCLGSFWAVTEQNRREVGVRGWR